MLPAPIIPIAEPKVTLIKSKATNGSAKDIKVATFLLLFNFDKKFHENSHKI